eukprot:91795-Rhodomonas_salina.1
MSCCANYDGRFVFGCWHKEPNVARVCSEQGFIQSFLASGGRDMRAGQRASCSPHAVASCSNDAASV